MSPRHSQPPPQPPAEEPSSSKSERKRAAHAAQDLGEALIGLTEQQLAALALPETLAEAVREARRIGSRAALARQRQYIGKLMRDIDPQPIRAALAARSEQDARETQRFKRAETWRARLLTQDTGEALEELAQLRPGLDRAHWQRLVAAAVNEQKRSRGTMGAAARELFRALRALLG